MKSAAEWFAQLQAPPDEGLVDQPMRVISPPQIAAIQVDALEHAASLFLSRPSEYRGFDLTSEQCANLILAEASKLRSSS